MPPCSLRRRSILCGTFRGALSGTGFSLPSPLRPLALPGALPCHEFRQPLRSRHNDARKMINVSQDGVRTFLPLQPRRGGFTPPFFGLSQRSPGSPAIFIITCESQISLPFAKGKGSAMLQSQLHFGLYDR